MPVSFCNRHPSKEAEFICLEGDCRDMLCGDCRPLHTRWHETISIEGLAAQLGAQLRSQLSDINFFRKAMDSINLRMQELSRRLKSFLDSERVEIYSIVRAGLDNCHNCLIAELRSKIDYLCNTEVFLGLSQRVDHHISTLRGVVAQLSVSFRPELIPQVEQLTLTSHSIAEECSLFNNYSIIFKNPEILRSDPGYKTLSENVSRMFSLDYRT